MAPGVRGIQREHRIAGSIPLRNARLRCPAGAAFANKTDFPNRGGQGDNKEAAIFLGRSRLAIMAHAILAI
jgi:hypothetical protein